jgi:hypothetical protein
MKYRAGERAKVPLDFAVHLLAARYGTTPRSIMDTWTADELGTALAYESFMGRREG